MWGLIGKLILGRVLMDPEVKRRAVQALRDAALRTDTRLDDNAVQMIDEAWSVIVPILVEKAPRV